MKLRMPVWALFCLGIVGGIVLGAAGVLLYEKLAHGPLVREAEKPGERLSRLSSFGKLRSGETPTVVAAVGRLTPQGDVIDIGGSMGERLQNLDVEEGNWVEKGAILGYLDSHDERQAERNAAAAQLDEAMARRDAETAYADALIKQADVGVRQAKELDPLDIQAQAAKVQELATELETAQKDLDRLKSLTSPGAIPQQKMDQQVQLVRRFQAELVAARATLAKAKAGESLSKDKAQADLEAAQAGRKRAEVSLVQSLTKNLALADAHLERTILRAPRAGYILKIITHPGERSDYKTILKLGDTRVMYAVAEVYETDAPLVRPGQRATVTSPSLSQALTGTVERTGQIIFKNDVLHVDPAADADARVVETWIRLDPSDLPSRMTNMQVDVVIELGGASALSTLMR